MWFSLIRAGISRCSWRFQVCSGFSRGYDLSSSSSSLYDEELQCVCAAAAGIHTVSECSDSIRSWCQRWNKKKKKSVGQICTIWLLFVMKQEKTNSVFGDKNRMFKINCSGNVDFISSCSLQVCGGKTRQLIRVGNQECTCWQMRKKSQFLVVFPLL